MATKYISSLTGPEMDSALTDMAYHNSEAYAVGTRNGVAVGSSDVTYHNNSKYWAEQVYGYTDRAEDAANRAEAAVPSGTAGAVFFDRAQTLTTAQQEQARANIMAGGSNRNLLDNWYFVGGGSQLGDGVFPINQRGQGAYTGATYTIDRWIIASSSIYVTPNAGYLELSGTAGNNFSQVMDPNLAKALYGKTVTASALMYDGTILTGTGIFPPRPASGWNFAGFVYGTDAALIIGTSELYRSEFFIQTKSASAKVCAVKLELGTVSTLANDVPPDYGEELAKCQRYFCRIYGDPIGTGYISSGLGTAFILVPTGVTMRAKPTVSYSGAFSVRVQGSTISVSAMTFATPAHTGGGVGIVCTLSSNAGSVGACAMYQNQTTAYIDLSADL